MMASLRGCSRLADVVAWATQDCRELCLQEEHQLTIKRLLSSLRSSKAAAVPPALHLQLVAHHLYCKLRLASARSEFEQMGRPAQLKACLSLILQIRTDMLSQQGHGSPQSASITSMPRRRGEHLCMPRCRRRDLLSPPSTTAMAACAARGRNTGGGLSKA